MAYVSGKMIVIIEFRDCYWFVQFEENLAKCEKEFKTVACCCARKKKKKKWKLETTIDPPVICIILCVFFFFFFQELSTVVMLGKVDFLDGEKSHRLLHIYLCCLNKKSG